MTSRTATVQGAAAARIHAAIDQCSARWWTGSQIVACQHSRVADSLRCKHHQPDGSRLDDRGRQARADA